MLTPLPCDDVVATSLASPAVQQSKEVPSVLGQPKATGCSMQNDLCQPSSINRMYNKNICVYYMKDIPGNHLCLTNMHMTCHITHTRRYMHYHYYEYYVHYFALFDLISNYIYIYLIYSIPCVIQFYFIELSDITLTISN